MNSLFFVIIVLVIAGFVNNAIYLASLRNFSTCLNERPRNSGKQLVRLLARP